MIAKRYELLDEAWAAVADPFTETHGRWAASSERPPNADGVLWVQCPDAVCLDMPERFGPW